MIIATSIASVLVLIQVFMTRYNVVIGGQEISKAMRGYLDHYVPTFGIEDALVALTAQYFLCRVYVLSKIFTIGFVDEKLINEAESCGGGDAAPIERIKT